ncbi:MAG: SCO family protein [Opitutaceae bacterium]|nr:SCO family protein [Opitutaceae bacterium]
MPGFLLAATGLYELFLAAVMLVPDAAGAFGAFAREFKVWCFSYDPRTGGMAWAAVWIMFLEPVFIASLVVALWRRAVGELLSPAGLRAHWRAVLTGLATAALTIGGMFLVGGAGAADQLVPPFPGERIRTAIEPPDFSFGDQEGNSFRLEDARGRVVLMTGIYAYCSTSCPEILREIQALQATLPEEVRARLTVVALSLSPEYDSDILRQRIAEGYDQEYPHFRYLNGEPEPVHDVLTRLGFSRVKDSRTGVITHTNLFILVDAQGRIAYRLSLDARLRPWLREAVLALAGEASRG